MCDALAALARNREIEESLAALRPLLAAYMQLHEEDDDVTAVAFAMRKIHEQLAGEARADVPALRGYLGVLMAELLVSEHGDEWDALASGAVRR